MSFKKQMRALLIMLLLSVSASALADKTIKVNVLRNKHGDNQVTFSATFNLESPEYQLTTVWRSPNGITCDIILVDGKKQEGAFTCRSPDRYKAQTTFNCSVHVSKKQSAFMYFSHGGDIAESGDFYIWCGDKGVSPLLRTNGTR